MAAARSPVGPVTIRYCTGSYSPPLRAHKPIITEMVISVGASLTKQLVIGKPVAAIPPSSSSVTVSAGANATTRTMPPPR